MTVIVLDIAPVLVTTPVRMLGMLGESVRCRLASRYLKTDLTRLPLDKSREKGGFDLERLLNTGNVALA